MKEISSPHSPSHWGPWCHMHCGLGAPAMGWRSVASYPWQGGNSFEYYGLMIFVFFWGLIIYIYVYIYRYIFFTHFGSFKYCWCSLRQHEHRNVATRPSSFETWVCRPGALCAALNSAGCCCVSPGVQKKRFQRHFVLVDFDSHDFLQKLNIFDIEVGWMLGSQPRVKEHAIDFWSSTGTNDDIDLDKFYGFFFCISLILVFLANKDQNNSWKRSINRIFEQIDFTEPKRKQNILKIYMYIYFFFIYIFWYIFLI